MGLLIDRERVIKGLKCLAQKQVPMANPCKDCGYNDRPNYAICVKDIAYDALELLKEQKAVTPIPPTDESDLWKCGNCNHQLFRCTHQRYCDKCGKAVKWNDK